MLGKYIMLSIPPIANLIPSMEVRIAHAGTAIKAMQYHNLFPALAIVCGLLADASRNEMVGLVDRKAIDKAMSFLTQGLVAVQLSELGEE